MQPWSRMAEEQLELVGEEQITLENFSEDDVGTVIAMPLGDDVDDFPSGTYLENLEDECESVSAAVESSKGGATSTMEKAA